MVGKGHNKRDIRRRLAWVRRLKIWQLVVILLLISLAAASLLRLNNLGMVERRQAVYEADKSGDQQAIKQSLVDLQRYVSSHMNTDLGANGVQLVHSYQRAEAAALERATDVANPRSKVYQQASVDCRARFVGGVESFRSDYVQCVIDRVSALSAQDEADYRLNMPQPEQYRFDFASPRWSPDGAGFAVALGVLVAAIIVIRLLAEAFLRWLLSRHYRSV